MAPGASTIPRMPTKVKIGMAQSGRELEVEVDDPEAFVLRFEEAVTSGQKLWWVTDGEGNRHGLVVDRIAYVEVAPGRDRTVGFG